MSDNTINNNDNTLEGLFSWNVSSSEPLLTGLLNNQGPASFDNNKADMILAQLSILNNTVNDLNNTVNDLRGMMSRIQASQNRVSSGIFSQQSDTSSSPSADQRVQLAVKDIFSRPDKIKEIVADSLSNRGLRCFSKKIVSEGSGVPKSQRKQLITSMCALWLKKENILYGMDTEEEETKKRLEDASERYDNTYSLIVVLCKTRYADQRPHFRWNHIAKEEKKEVACVMEYLVLDIVGIAQCLPLHLAVDSWAVCHLLSVAIRNEGRRKEGTASNTTENLQGFGETVENELDSFSVFESEEEDEPQVSSADNTGSPPTPVVSSRSRRNISPVVSSSANKRGKARQQ